MKNKRILLEIDRLNLVWSGVEKSLLNLRKLLLEMNCDVDVCGLNNISNSNMNVIETLSYETLEFTNYDIIILSLEGKDLLNFIVSHRDTLYNDKMFKV